MEQPARRSSGLDATQPLSGTEPQGSPVAPTLAHGAPATPGTQRSQPGSPIMVLGGYELLDELGRGGMGVVYRARQRRLNRLVAVKMIRSGDFASSQELQRFLAEAESAAKLVHPGIVPVYEVGEDAGRIFFSMGLVEGGCLADLVADRPLGAIEAAQLVRQICDAVHYAHEQGIVHRDLKPANILLDRERRPLVTDFGLAKRLDGSSDLTATGQILGTPGYMPPEQARGDLQGISPRSDVYALGAVLYRLVTGRPPFQGSSTIETVQDVLNREPIAPRQLVSTIPKDLETICLKCLEKAPAKRYESAWALAEELARFERRDPILARPLGRMERTWRWCRKHPGMAASLAVAVTAMVGGTTFSTYFGLLASNRAASLTKAVEELQRQTNRANKSAELEKQHAEVASKQADLALSTLRKTIFEIQRELKKVRGTQEVRRRLLRNALESLKEVAASQERSGSIDRQTMAAHSDLGALFEEVVDVDGMGGTAAAIQQYQLALDIAQRRFQANPTDPGVIDDLALSLQRLGSIQVRAGAVSEALRLLKEAGRQHEALVKLKPGNPDALNRQAECLAYLGDAYLLSAQSELGLQAHQKYLSISEQLLAESPDDDSRIEGVLMGNTLVGKAYRSLLRHEEALPHYERALELSRQQFAKRPDDDKARRGVSDSCNSLGVTYIELSRPEKSEAILREGLEHSRILAAADPANLEDQNGLAIALQAYAFYLQGQQQWQEALDHYQQSLEVNERLLQADPRDASLLENTASALSKIADVYQTGWGQLDRAEEYLQREVKLVEPLIGRDAANVELQRTLSIAYNRLADLYRQKERFDEAIDVTRRDLAIAQDLAKKEPDNLQRHLDLLISHFTLGEIQVSQLQFAAADDSYAAAERIIAQHPMTDSEGSTAIILKHHRQVCALAPRAIASGEVDSGEVEREPYPALRKDLWKLVNISRTRQGDHAAAERAAVKISETTGVDDPESYSIAAAECYAHCLRALMKKLGSKTPSPEEQAAKERYEREALRFLAQSIQQGFAEPSRVNSDPCWEPLRDHKEFRALAAKLQH